MLICVWEREKQSSKFKQHEPNVTCQLLAKATRFLTASAPRNRMPAFFPSLCFLILIRGLAPFAAAFQTPSSAKSINQAKCQSQQRFAMYLPFPVKEHYFWGGSVPALFWRAAGVSWCTEVQPDGDNHFGFSFCQVQYLLYMSLVWSH